MRINGQWLLSDEGVVRPILRGTILTVAGNWEEVEFLVDTGADQTVLTAAVLAMTELPTSISSNRLVGAGGSVPFVAVNAQIRFPCEGTSPAVFQGQFAAFTDPDTMDMSVLGRDILNLFAVITDRPGDVVCLLGQRHRYKIEVI